MLVCLDPACAFCPVWPWWCPHVGHLYSVFPLPGPAPVAFQQPCFGLAPVATHHWSQAAASGLAGALGDVTAPAAVTKTATQKGRKSVLDRGQATEGSRVVCPSPLLSLQMTDTDMSTAKEPVDKRSLEASYASRKSALGTATRSQCARTNRA